MTESELRAREGRRLGQLTYDVQELQATLAAVVDYARGRPLSTHQGETRLANLRACFEQLAADAKSSSELVGGWIEEEASERYERTNRAASNVSDRLKRPAVKAAITDVMASAVGEDNQR
jgi:hypothetical protein